MQLWSKFQQDPTKGKMLVHDVLFIPIFLAFLQKPRIFDF
jgi:hypothetical protein